MAAIDDAIFSDVQQMLGKTERLVNSDAFRVFIHKNKQRILSKYRIQHRSYTSEKLQSAIIDKLDETFSSVRALGFYMCLASAKQSLITRRSDTGQVNIARESNRIMADAGSQIPPEDIVKSAYLRASYASIIYQYIMFVATSTVNVDVENMFDAQDIREEMLVKLLINGMLYHFAESLLNTPDDAKGREIAMSAIRQFHAPYFVYGDLSISPSTFWSSDIEVEERDPDAKGLTDYMVLSLEQELRWNIVMEALKILRSGDVFYKKREDSRGKEFNYEGSGYDEESDSNMLVLFLTYRSMSVPFTKAIETTVDSIVSEFNAPGGEPTSVIGGAIKRARSILKHEPIVGESRKEFKRRREQIKIAAKHVASAMMAELASKTRKSSLRISEISDVGAPGHSVSKVMTPFPRMFAVFNSDICEEWNYDMKDVYETMLKTTWDLLSGMPMKDVDIENPGATVSDGSNVEFHKKTPTKAPEQPEEEAEGTEEIIKEETEEEPSRGAHLESFLNECVGALILES